MFFCDVCGGRVGPQAATLRMRLFRGVLRLALCDWRLGQALHGGSVRTSFANFRRHRLCAAMWFSDVFFNVKSTGVSQNYCWVALEIIACSATWRDVTIS